MANQTLTDEVRNVLLRGEISGNTFRVPNNPDGSRLDRALYAKVDAALGNLGGKWNTRAKAHLFDSDCREKLDSMLKTGVAVDQAGNEKKKFQAFYTPPEVAAQIAALANVKGHLVLEPSAGEGALAVACMAVGAFKVRCIELNPDSVAALEKNGFDTTCADFLTQQPASPYKRIVMNPPFTRGQDLKHLKHAMDWVANPGGVLVCVLPKRHPAEFTNILRCLEWDITPLEAGAFRKSGTNIETMILRVKF